MMYVAMILLECWSAISIFQGVMRYSESLDRLDIRIAKKKRMIEAEKDKVKEVPKLIEKEEES